VVGDRSVVPGHLAAHHYSGDVPPHPPASRDGRAGRGDRCAAHWGGFTLGVGSGEDLNEHILGQRWPSAEERLEMLEEAVSVMRDLFSGQLISHAGRHYTVDTARLYSLPQTPPGIYMSGFGKKAVKW